MMRVTIQLGERLTIIVESLVEGRNRIWNDVLLLFVKVINLSSNVHMYV